MTTFDGYFDSVRHQPASLTRYDAMDLTPPLLNIAGWEPTTVYINDLRQGINNGRELVKRAVTSLHRCSKTTIAEATSLLIMEPDGLDGRSHAVGGGYTAPGLGITFYIARNKVTDGTGRWCKYLCADVSVRA